MKGKRKSLQLNPERKLSKLETFQKGCCSHGGNYWRLDGRRTETSWFSQESIEMLSRMLHNAGFVSVVATSSGTSTSTCFTCSDKWRRVQSDSANAQLEDPPLIYLTSYETETSLPVLQGFSSTSSTSSQPSGFSNHVHTTIQLLGVQSNINLLIQIILVLLHCTVSSLPGIWHRA